MTFLKKVSGIVIAAGLAALAGCGSDSTTTTPDAAQGFPQPSGTVAVNFSVDDTANKVYAAGDLEWKGSMAFDSTTRKATKDSTWTGPFAKLYDDGPWTAGGHEPAGATAGDHKWGVTVFIAPPATGSDTYEYGLNDASYASAGGNGWSWNGSNGTFQVAAGATAAVTAQGQTFAKFGTTDLQLSIDLTKVDAATFDITKVRIKGSAWGWNNVDVTPAGASTKFTLSDSVGAGKKFAHNGLLAAGDKPEFIWVFGTGDGKEYKDAGGTAATTGVTAGTKASGASSFTNVAVTVNANKNTTVTVP